VVLSPPDREECPSEKHDPLTNTTSDDEYTKRKGAKEAVFD
jgi:hypothetical protein